MSVARNFLLIARKSNKCLFAAKRCLSLDKDHIVTSEFPDVQIPEVDLPELAYSYFGRWGDKIATVSATRVCHHNLRDLQVKVLLLQRQKQLSCWKI